MSSTWYDCFTKRIVSSTRAGPAGGFAVASRPSLATLGAFPREVALDDAPDVLLRAVALHRREDEHRALPEAAHDDEPQILLVHAGKVRVFGKTHRHRAVVDRRVLCVSARPGMDAMFFANFAIILALK